MSRASKEQQAAEERRRELDAYKLAPPRDEYAARRIRKTRWIEVFRLKKVTYPTIGFVTWDGQRDGLAARRGESPYESVPLSSGHESIESAVNAIVDDDLALRQNATKRSAEAQNWE